MGSAWRRGETGFVQRRASGSEDSTANTMALQGYMSDGREEREQQEYWREQEKKRDRDDRMERELPDQWKPERRES